MANQNKASSFAMSSKEINFTENLNLIKKLVANKSIDNFEKIEESVQTLFDQLDADNRQSAAKVFQHLIRSFQSYVPPGNLPLFHELAKLYQDKGRTNGVLNNGGQEEFRQTGVQEELDTLLQAYAGLCKQMKRDTKDALIEDLTENGNLGQCTTEMGLSTEEYNELCEQLFNYFE